MRSMPKEKQQKSALFGQVYSCRGADAHDTEKVQYGVYRHNLPKTKKLKKKTEQLEQSLDKATGKHLAEKLADAKLHRDYEDAVAVLDRIPKEVLAAYTHRTEKERETAYGR